MYLTTLRLGENGRLGNQLFQVASSLGIAVSNGCTPVFPDWWAGRKLFENDLPPASEWQIKTQLENYGQVTYQEK